MSTNLVKHQTSAITVDATGLIEQWLDHCRDADGATPETLTAYHKGLDVFTSWLRETGSGPVTPVIIVQFKGWLQNHYSAQTVNLRLAAVRSFYRWCVNTEQLAISPAASIKGAKRPKSRQHKRDALTDAEVTEVLDTCDLGTLKGLRDAAILALMAYCALREIEVKRANIGDLRTSGNRLTLEIWGKGRLEDDKEVGVVPRSQEHIVRSWLAQRVMFENHRDGDPLFVSLSNRNRGERLTTRAIRAMVKRRYRMAGVVGPRKTTHSLRHSAITSVIRHGATPMQARTLARHSSLDTTLGYYHEVGRIKNPPEDLIDYGES
jgi:site-specific recombinase XerD